MMNLFGETPVRKLLTLHALSGETLVEATATPGNPCTFTADVSKALKQCKVNFTPIQSGSGDPSPENVRPITGWTGINVYHSGEDETDYDTYAVSWQTEAGTVYGGNLDLTTGVLTVTYISLNVGDTSKTNWTYGAGNGSCWYTSIWGYPALKSFGNYETASAYCEKMLVAPYVSFSHDNSADIRICVDGNGKPKLRYNAYTEEMKQSLVAFLSDMQFIAELATPVTIQLTAQQITALIGENNLWSDANGNLEVKYMKKG